MGMFDFNPGDDKLTQIRLAIKTLFPSVQTVSFVKNWSSLMTVITLKFGGTLVTVPLAEEMIIQTPVDTLVLHIAKIVPEEFHISKYMPQEKAEGFKGYVGSTAHVDEFAETLKKLNIEKILWKYGKVELNAEQQKVIHDKVLENIAKNPSLFPKGDFKHLGTATGKLTPGKWKIPVQDTVPTALHKALPAIRSMVKYPCGCSLGTLGPIHAVIIHLNDRERWTRHQIADWLESLDVDLEFKTPEEIK